MEIKDVVDKLVGPINPVGDSNIDAKRLENLKELTQLVDKLLYDIDNVSSNAKRQEASMRQAGEYAKNFLIDVTSAL